MEFVKGHHHHHHHHGSLLALLGLLLLSLSLVASGPLNSMNGDLCGTMDGRKFYLEADTQAKVTAINVTLPLYPRLAAPSAPVKLAPLPFNLLPQHYYREANTNTIKSTDPFTHKNQTQPPTIATTTTTTTTTTTASAPAPATPPSPTHPGAAQEEEEGEGVGVASLSEPFRCSTEFRTCPECHLEFTFSAVNLPSCSQDKSCRCDYLRVREPPYTGGSGGRDICSTGGPAPPAFATQTREVTLDFLYASRHAHAFTLTVTARRNQYHITGQANVTQGYISSPFFPELYPKTHWMEYRLQANSDDTRIKLNFVDFLLSPWSYVEVEDTNKTRVGVFSGSVFRPPVLVSSGPHITVRFSGNGETARGFNLRYSFVTAGSLQSLAASTDCGGFVTNFGGTITMMNMASGKRNFTVYDCVWLFQPPRNYAFKSHLSIRLVQFQDVVPGSSVEVRQGLTSRDYQVEEVLGGAGGRRGEEHLAAADTGFYVRLRGGFTEKSKMALVYTSFSYLGNCYPVTDFLCHNHRCIPKMLRCDGFDHCGDGSDEPASCYVGPGNKSLTPEDAAWWYQNTPNYYFPQKDNIMLSDPHGWSSLLLFLTLLALVLIMFGLLSYMFRAGVQAGGGGNGGGERGAGHRDRRGVNSSRNASLSDGVEIFDAAADDPPLYEPPPDYEEVVKLILSGNNLKLVRRPGGVTAWVPDKSVEGVGGMGGGAEHTTPTGRPQRTRHASLDLERGVEVVLWDANGYPRPPRRGAPEASGAFTATTAAAATASTAASAGRPRMASFAIPGHVRRSSLPAAPLPEIVRAHVQGHGVSMAPETITEAPEGLDSPMPGRSATPARVAALRGIQPAVSSPTLSVRSFAEDSSAPSTPGRGTPGPRRASRSGAGRASRMNKRGRRRKSHTPRPRDGTRRGSRDDDAAPPSYEDAMQASRGPTPALAATPTPAPDSIPGPSTSTATADNPSAPAAPAASLVSESTQTSLDQDDAAPTERLRAARELFRRMAREDEGVAIAESPVPRPASAPAHAPAAPTAPAPAPRPSVRAPARRSLPPHHSGTISRGTVKARTAMLLRARAAAAAAGPAGECGCSGACSCAHFRENSVRRGEAVSSRVSYYLAVQEAASPEGAPPRPVPGPKKRRLARNRCPLPGPDQPDPHHSPHPCSQPSPQPNPEPSPQPSSRPSPQPQPRQQAAPLSPEPSEDDQEQPQPRASPVEDPRGVLPSIRNRVLQYDDLTRSTAPPPPPHASPGTPSPGRHPATPLSASPSPATPPPVVLDSPVRPGLVRDARCKILTALRQEAEAPRVPYVRLMSEEGEAPLSPPPLREDEAKSLEQWDSYLTGRPAAQPQGPPPPPQPRPRDGLRLKLNNKCRPGTSGQAPRRPRREERREEVKGEEEEEEEEEGDKMNDAEDDKKENDDAGAAAAAADDDDDYDDDDEEEEEEEEEEQEEEDEQRGGGEDGDEDASGDDEDDDVLMQVTTLDGSFRGESPPTSPEPWPPRLDDTLNETLPSDDDDHATPAPRAAPPRVKVPVPSPRGSKMMPRPAPPPLRPGHLSPEMVNSGILPPPEGRQPRWDYI
ncbi:uncharacterized protein LOC126981911 [Eriocheir sinensis]|uniref:uncharacterized protein LOC126981911 n=1 Tax=Eriocheir sinensis TaxID=95602 RepID=UPI0021CA1F9E|nr:uncharacterized protein LOC126981911 [Eriocheir sinensis]XP_050689526.1 uncharacterized protein LOC126981911 [Eriocheir sinensis]